jgi:hypothetical protein
MFRLKKIIVFVVVISLTQSTHTMQGARGFIKKQCHMVKAMGPFARTVGNHVAASYLVRQQIAGTQNEALVLFDVLKVQAQIAIRKINSCLMKPFLWRKNQ